MSIGERALVDRIAALALLAVALGLVWFGPVTAYRDLLAAGAARIYDKGQLLARYRRLAAEPLAATAPATAAASLLFPAVPDSQAVALLQETVKSAAAAAQAQIQGLQVLRTHTASGAVRIGVRIQASGDIASLSRLLYAIEAARPILYPDNLQVQVRPMQAAGSAAPLDFQFDVSGFEARPS